MHGPSVCCKARVRKVSIVNVKDLFWAVWDLEKA